VDVSHHARAESDRVGSRRTSEHQLKGKETPRSSALKKASARQARVDAKCQVKGYVTVLWGESDQTGAARARADQDPERLRLGNDIRGGGERGANGEGWTGAAYKGA